MLKPVPRPPCSPPTRVASSDDASLTFPDSATRSYGLRVRVGSSVSWRPLTVVRNSPVRVSIVSGTATTSTFSVSPPTSSRTSTAAVAPTDTLTRRAAGLKPVSVNVTSYVSAVTFAKTYWPSVSDTVSRVKPVLTDFAVTVTPGTTPPDVSATVPEIRPVSIWAHAGAYAAASATSATAKLNRTASRLIDVSSA